MIHEETRQEVDSLRTWKAEMMMVLYELDQLFSFIVPEDRRVPGEKKTHSVMREWAAYRDALATAAAELQSHPAYSAWTPDQLCVQFLEEARRER